MRFVFVRHGHYDGKGKPAAEKKRTPLNAAGRRAAKAAGEYLMRENIVPDIVITTDTERTKETAKILLDALGMDNVKPQSRGGGFSAGKASLDAKLVEWLAGVEPAPSTVIFVGHDPSQAYCLGQLANPPDIPGENRACVLIYERNDAGEWMCSSNFAGLPK